MPLITSPMREAATVVWWRADQAFSGVTVPRVHRIGWVDVTGQPHGELELSSHHLRLDHSTIQVALAAHLVPTAYPTPPAIVPVGLFDQTRLSVGAVLIIAGHRIHQRDLTGTYGLDIVGGVSAELLGGGPRADIVLEQTLNLALRQSVLTTIRTLLDQFARSTPRQLVDSGWTPRKDDRWELLLRQP